MYSALTFSLLNHYKQKQDEPRHPDNFLNRKVSKNKRNTKFVGKEIHEKGR
jgi:hypothetical protein